MLLQGGEMALVIADPTVQSDDTPHLREALQRIHRQDEAREKLLRAVSPWGRILEEQRRLQEFITPYHAIQAQLLRAQTVQEPAIQALDVFARERARLLPLLELDWESQTRKELLHRELQYHSMQGLIGSLSQWDVIQRQLVGPWPLVGPWRDAKTMRWLLWALQKGDSADQEAAFAELATMIPRPRLSREASLQLRERSRLMRMSPDEYWRWVVLPHALFLVWGARKIPRRIQLAGNGQGRVLDEQGRWTPQAPADKLSTELLASYLFDEIPKAAVCILTDQDYPKPANDLWHAPPLERKDDQGTSERVPRVVRLPPGACDAILPHGHIRSPSPEVMAIVKLDLHKLWTNGSARQRQILELLLKGYSVPEIASELGIKSQAVHGQLDRLQQKYRAG
jgi:Bacterial regulatory proteins, luxR family